MVALDGSWQRNVGEIRLITIQIVLAIFASAFLTSVMIASFVSFDASKTLTATELWRNGLSVSAIPPTLIGLLVTFRMRESLERLRMTHEELVSLAWIDGLTGLLNRQGFDVAAAEAFAEARRLGQPISALICDIDTFRDLNDKYGHEAGDIALRNVAQMLEESIGHRTAVLGRQGGDEFAILLPGVDLVQAVRIAEGLREVCEARALVEQDPAAKFAISVGAGTEASGASELGAVLRRADAALYRAKRAGGNQVVPAPPLFVQRQSMLEIERSATRSTKLVASPRRIS
jgi:diguanylate cyclase (GGDEF)-like protein